jgi:hypothetical protein
MYSDMVMAERPPYITFERRAVERRKVLEEGGTIEFVDTDYALITPSGSKDVVEKVVAEWLPRLAEDVKRGRLNPQWADAYRAAYKAWKEGQEPPVNGTSVKNWPAVSPAEVKQLIACHVLTIEDLAAANEELIGRLGMGARSLKQRATSWLKERAGPGSMALALDAMRVRNEELQTRIDEMTKQITGLQQMLNERRRVEAPAIASLEDRMAARQSDDSAIDQALDDILE